MQDLATIASQPDRARLDLRGSALAMFLAKAPFRDDELPGSGMKPRRTGQNHMIPSPAFERDSRRLVRQEAERRKHSPVRRLHR